MLRISFERKYRVLLASFSGAFTPDDIALLNATVADFRKSQGPVRGIVDMTAVEVIGVTLEDMTRAARGQPQIMAGQDRVYVIPQTLLFGMGRLFGTYQGLAGFTEPHVVRTMPEACEILGLVDPDFQPVEK
jgi:hypothetical protein